MTTLVALVAALIRLLRPTRGAHTSPLGYLRELRTEARRRRANRIRRYAGDVPTVAQICDSPEGSRELAQLVAPHVPAPRLSADDSPSGVLRPVPADYVPVVDLSAVAVPASIVRGHYRAHEARQERARVAQVDRDRLGVAVLMDLGVSA